MNTILSSSRGTAALAALGLSWQLVSLNLQGADSTPPPPPPPPPPAAKPAAPVKFRPLTTAAPSVRVTGGSRGTGDAAVALDVLVPDSVGLTTQEQPSLYWYQSKPSNSTFELTLLQDKKAKPLVRYKVNGPTTGGIHRLKLADHGVKLEPGVEYQWVVALVSDPENRSTDLVASGAIKRVEPSTGLAQALSQSKDLARVQAYAEHGIWYDTLETLSEQIESHPQDLALRAARADLLAQVGLSKVSAAEANNGK